MEQTPLRVVFINISQMLYSLSLLAIASIEWRLHQEIGLPPWLAALTGCLLAVVTFVLLVWNALDGFRKLVAERRWLPTALLAAIYLSMIVLLVHAFPTLVARK